MKPALSWSAISEYTQCSKKYWHSRIIRSPRKPFSYALFEGTCGHAALEYFYTAKRDSRVLPADAVIDFFNDYWDTAIRLEELDWTETLRGKAVTLDPEARRKFMATSVRGHLEKLAPKIEPLYMEKQWRVSLPECSHDVMGICDLIATDFTIHDFKFTKKMVARDNIDDAAHWSYGGYGAQLTCYALARAEGAFGPCDNWQDIPLYLDVSLKGGASEQLTTTRNAEQITWFRRALVDIARAVAAQIYFPNPINCGWCDFREICRGDV